MLNPTEWVDVLERGLSVRHACTQQCNDPFTLLALSAAATAVGTGISAYGTIATGNYQKKASEYTAKQMDVRAKDEQAAGQREAAEYGRKKDLALSRGQTLNASGGFTATDPTSLGIADEIAKYGTLQEQTALYGGEARRSATEAQAKGTRFEGDFGKYSSNIKAAATIANGGATIIDRFSPKPASTGSSLRYG